MREIKTSAPIYFFAPDNQPVATVAENELFLVDCPDCYGGQIKTAADLRPNIDISIMDASAGPIAVAGVRAGDVIKVRVHELRLAAQGVMVTSPGLGPLGDRIEKPTTKIVAVRDNQAVFSDAIRLPVAPMLGVLGVAPAGEPVHCAVPGDHGGNMDTKDIRPGNHVYFPVFVDGANLALGDIHACMGDGELSGTGVEIAGQALLSVEKCPSLRLAAPVIEDAQSFMTVASDADFHACARRAVGDAADMIAAGLGLSFEDAYRLVSATCDLRVSQIVNDKLTLRVVIPKTLLPRLPAVKAAE